MTSNLTTLRLKSTRSHHSSVSRTSKQFEQAVRTEAAEASKHYEVIYFLEQSIRNLITETREDAVGADWWNSGKVPQGCSAGSQQPVEDGERERLTQRSPGPH